MKQKLIVALSAILLLAALLLIARDLFKKPALLENPASYIDDFKALKYIDSTLIGYQRINVIQSDIEKASGLAVNSRGQLFVCGEKELAIFNHSGSKTAVFPLDTAANCIAATEQHIYLGQGSSIGVYNMEGSKHISWRTYNSDSYITSLVTTDENIFAADAVNKLVLAFSPGGSIIKEIGRKDTVNGVDGFLIPSMYFDLAAGSYNDIWIVNPGRLRVENYSSTGALRSIMWEERPENNGFTGCCNPAHFTLLPNGDFITYEKGVDKLKHFNIMGNFVCFVAGAGYFKGDADFGISGNLVKDLVSDSKGLVYILDYYGQINIFRKKDL